MQRQLFGQKRNMDKEMKDGMEITFQDVKWRRRGTDRRCGEGIESRGTDYVEKRSCGDRRHDFMTLVSRIIFPRGWAKQ
jgi:hypothetical protein